MERPRVYDRRPVLDAREQKVAEQQDQSQQPQKKSLESTEFFIWSFFSRCRWSCSTGLKQH